MGLTPPCWPRPPALEVSGAKSSLSTVEIVFASAYLSGKTLMAETLATGLSSALMISATRLMLTCVSVMTRALAPALAVTMAVVGRRESRFLINCSALMNFTGRI